MNIAIVGATGNVGRKLIEVLERTNFEFSEIYLIASDKRQRFCKISSVNDL